MGKEVLTFGNVEIEKNKFYRHKTPIFLGDVDRSNEISFGEKNLSTLLVTCIMVIKLNH